MASPSHKRKRESVDAIIIMDDDNVGSRDNELILGGNVIEPMATSGDNTVDSLYIPSDTEMVRRSIGSSCATLHEIVFMHQVYAIMKNNSIVDEEILQMREKEKTLKCLQCAFKYTTGSKNTIPSTALIDSTEYINSISTYLRRASSATTCINIDTLAGKFGTWIRNSSQISTSRRNLKEFVNYQQQERELSIVGQHHDYLNDIEIDILVQTGFLIYRNSIEVGSYGLSGGLTDRHVDLSNTDDDLFWVAHPAVRPLIVMMMKVEQDIITQIKKTRYKEISQRKLQNMCWDISSTNSSTMPAASGPSISSSSSSSSSHITKTKNISNAKKGILRESPFPLSYHLLDLEGRGVIYKVAAPATNDHIIRLRS